MEFTIWEEFPSLHIGQYCANHLRHFSYTALIDSFLHLIVITFLSAVIFHNKHILVLVHGAHLECLFMMLINSAHSGAHL